MLETNMAYKKMKAEDAYLSCKSVGDSYIREYTKIFVDYDVRCMYQLDASKSQTLDWRLSVTKEDVDTLKNDWLTDNVHASDADSETCR